MNTTKHEKSIKELFVGECWEYLRENFRKFNETNKIKIALELCKKDIPQEFKGALQVTEMPSIQKAYPSGEANGTPTNRIVEFDIGSPDPTEAS
jgi:hypothetical protein